jgi:hypothetical protein
MAHWTIRFSALSAVLAASACGGTHLFKSHFDATPTGEAPAIEQAEGFAAVHGREGSVVVVDSPVHASGKWVRISREDAASPAAGLQGKFEEAAGRGEYSFTATMFMPRGSGTATLQFEQFAQPVGDLSSFLRIDLLPDDTLRFDGDETTTFGSFPRDKPFFVHVALVIAASGSTAHVAVSGDDASGSADRTIVRFMAMQFGAVRLWMGHPHTGSFEATSIDVKRTGD